MTKNMLAAIRTLSMGLVLPYLAGCMEAKDEGPTRLGTGSEPPPATTRGNREGAPPTGLRQNPAQPQSDRPAEPTR